MRIALLALLVIAAQASAQDRCNAHFTFDGNVRDSGGNAHHGLVIMAGGGTGKATYVEGKSGQALLLDGTSAVRASVDLDQEACPQVTVTAWIKIGQTLPTGRGRLISTGSGHGPGLTAAGESLILNGTANGIYARKAIRANSDWMFIAGVFDYTNGLYRLQWRNRSESKPIGSNPRRPDDALWIGAFNDGMSEAASGIAIDDVRVYGKALTENELAEIQAGAGSTPGGEGTWASANATVPVGAACATHDNCGAGAYCAWDRTCHPESHAPMQSLEVMPGTVSAENIVLHEEARFEDPEPVAAEQEAGPPEYYPAGPETVTEYSGSIGGIERRADLYPASAFLAKLQWFEDRDRPCTMHAGGSSKYGSTAASTQQSRTAQFGCSSGLYIGALFQDTDGHTVTTGVDSPVSAIQVCNNRRNANRRLKGVRVWGSFINPDGTTRAAYTNDVEELANCTDWSEQVKCPTNQIATGVVVMGKPTGTEDEHQITGLRLICHAVGVR